MLSPAGAQDGFTAANQALAAGRVGEARALYETWLGRHPDDAFARYNLSLCGGAYEGELERCLALDPPRAYGMVRLPEGEVKPVNLLRLRAGTRLASARRSFGLAQAASDWELSGDLELALVRAQVAPRELQAHFYQEYLESACVYTGRTDQVAVWGPGALQELVLRVSREGRVAPLDAVLPPEGHGLEVGADGAVRCYTLRGEHPVTVARVLLENPFSRTLQGFTQAHAGTALAWEAVKGLGVLDQVAASPFQTVDERRTVLRGDASAYGAIRLARLALEDVSVRPEALERLRVLLERQSFDEGEYLAASLELLAGKAEVAEGRLVRLAGLEPPRERPWRLLVQLLTARGELARALECAAGYAARFPQDPYPRYLQADLLARSGKAAEALALLQGLEEWVEPLYLQARLAGRSGQVARQRELLERLLSRDPWPYRAERLLAALCERLGETERAIELYKRYLRSLEAALYERQEYAEASLRFRELIKQ